MGKIWTTMLVDPEELEKKFPFFNKLFQEFYRRNLPPKVRFRVALPEENPQESLDSIVVQPIDVPALFDPGGDDVYKYLVIGGKVLDVETPPQINDTVGNLEEVYLVVIETSVLIEEEKRETGRLEMVWTIIGNKGNK